MNDSDWRREVSVARCPRSWACAEDRSDPIRQWVSEDRRSRTARWGAWAPKIRRQFGIIHLGGHRGAGRGREPVGRPRIHGGYHRAQRVATRRQAITDADRRAGVDETIDHPLRLELPEALGEHPVTDTWNADQ